jgi:hypothetical protein
MKYSRSLVATLLMSGGLLQLAPAVLADGTTAGREIDNTATATYSDGTNTVNATSNTVKVVVAEVAGIDVTAGIVTNKTTPGAGINQGNEAYYNFNITNTGNNPTQIHIPGNPDIAGDGTLTKVEYLPIGANPVSGWVNVPAAGLDTPVGSEIPVGGVIQVRVTVTVTGTSGAIAVSLGNTPGPNRSNQPFNTTANTNEVYTVGGNPANGPREASATKSENIGAIAKNNAFATVFLTRTGTTTNNTPTVATDDTISYALALKVGNNTTTDTSITAAPLVGTPIKLSNTTSGFADSTRILISTVIPAGTNLSAVAAAPPGWIKVYSITAKTDNTSTAEWTTQAPTTTTLPTAPTYAADLQAQFDLVNRVGFINDTSVASTVPISATPIGGFGFTVKKNAIGVTGTGTAGSPVAYVVDSMAQLFGSTPGSTAAVTTGGVITTPASFGYVVYDESGDQISNNSETVATLNTINATTGGAAASYDIDPGSNTGSGDFGEIDRYNYSYTTPAAFSLLNGPIGEPTAEGPIAPGSTTLNNEFDFTNKSSKVPANTLPGTAIDPDSVGFSNTVQNTGGSSAVIKLLPEKLAIGEQLPNGTTVRIHTAGDTQSVTYTVTAGGFTTTSAIPVQFTLANGEQANYLVEVDLPATSKLSTDDKSLIDTTPVGGYAVVINAFSSSGSTVTGTNALGTAVSTTAGEVVATNKTIDRVYTGFIKLTKEVRILQGEADAPVVTSGTQFANAAATKKPAKGNHIEYRVTYKNISELLVGAKNVVLNAGGLVITENGTTGGNTWAIDFNGDSKLDTSNVVGSAADSIPGSASIDLYSGTAGTVTSTDISGTTAATDVTSYVDTVTTSVTPGVSRSFSFKRRMN